jgi:nucleoside 2-deoxyribosyltransferase
MMSISNENCFLCGQKVDDFHKGWDDDPYFYRCKMCGPIKLTEIAVERIQMQEFAEGEKHILSISLRNRSFLQGNKAPPKPLSSRDLKNLISLYQPLDPLDKMNHALLTIDRLTKKAGDRIKIPLPDDLFLYHCKEESELETILSYLVDTGDIKAQDITSPAYKLWITAKGYQTLRELKQTNKESNSCFVAMWFNPELKAVYGQAIQPAIEYIEEGATEPRFRAVRIDNEEHVNDINDEIIAQIRRSRFMVCDLTGYRGGVYFEAGFAHGLGMPVIYTCRKDWCDEDQLKDDAGKIVEFLKDSSARPIQVKKEGVHFDLAHRNRIEWEIDKLDEFKLKLENRIKAVIV